MGGTSGGWASLGNIRSLEEKAKAALQGGKKNVFISFAVEDLDHINLLRGQPNNPNNDIEFNDYSVREPYDSDRADYIKQKISERILRTSVCVVYLTENSVRSEWVKWEVEQSLKMGKRVVAMHSRDEYHGTIPNWISSANVKIVPWSQLSTELKK
jgi:hypothetical protein